MQANRSSGRRRLLIAAGAVAAVLPLCLTGSATAVYVLHSGHFARSRLMRERARRGCQEAAKGP